MPTLGTTMSDACVARQPIFNRDLDVVGYELLFRDLPATVAAVHDHEAATTRVALDALTEIGLDQIVGNQRAWINVSRDFLLSELVCTLPPELVGLEILEDQHVDSELVDRVREMRAQGYRFALDDFQLGAGADELLEEVDVVKLDLMALGHDGLADHVRRLRGLPVRLLAEKVQTPEEHAFCRSLGCDRFQGFFYRRPELVSRRRIDAGRTSLMRLLARLQDPTTSLEALRDEVSLDVGLSLRLMRYINSAYVALPHQISSVGQAVTLLGPARLRRWAALSAFAGLARERSELTRVALVRARFCELAGAALDVPAAQCFTLGLFSVIDALTDTPLAEALHSVPFPDDMRRALIAHEGPLGGLVGAAIALEEAAFDRAEALAPSSGGLYVQALAWGDATHEALRDAQAAVPA